VIIRDEQASDYDEIRRLLTEAFGGEAEAKLVEGLRCDGEIAHALVAEHAGDVVGYVALSFLQSPQGALALAPVAVTPDRRRQGLGSALIDEALRRARAARSPMVFVLGEPEYYARFGFTAGAARGFLSPYAGAYFMALALTDVPNPPAPVVYSRRFAEL
jgi:putative acetyltransferase